MNNSKLTVACNWDPALIEGLRQYAPQIKHIFGKTKADIFSGGRAAGQVVEPEERAIAERYIRAAKDAGLAFNYLLNGTYLPDEYSPETTRRIREDLDWISSTGAEWITLCNPRLAEMIRDNYPNLSTNISVFAHVRTPRQVERWQRLGAKSICLDRNVMIDPKQISALRKASDIEYSLLVNDPCLVNCAIELTHDNLMSRASVSGEKYFHSCSFECLREFISRPAEIIASTYIRPEDIGLYEAMGIDCFKVVDRNRSTKFILNAAKAYAERKYHGNLIDLMSLFSAYDREPSKARLLKPEELSQESVDKFWKELPASLGLHIDNEEMEGYAIKRLGADCGARTCSRCNICPSYSGFVTYNHEAAEIAKKNIGLVIRTLNEKGL